MLCCNAQKDLPAIWHPGKPPATFPADSAPFRSLCGHWSYCLLQERSELRLPVSDAAAGPEAKALGRVLRTASAGTPTAAGNGSGLFLADLSSGPPLLEPAKAATSSAGADWVPWAAAVVGGVAGGAAALTQTRKVCDGRHSQRFPGGILRCCTCSQR